MCVDFYEKVGFFVFSVVTVFDVSSSDQLVIRKRGRTRTTGIQKKKN